MKYKAIKESPHKATINRLLVEGVAHRSIAEKLKKDFGMIVSHKTLNLYHRDELDALVIRAESPSEASEDEAPSFMSYSVDRSEVEQYVSGLLKAESSYQLKESARELVLESYVILSLITKEALARHARGDSRFPTDYLTKLVSLFGVIAK